MSKKETSETYSVCHVSSVHSHTDTRVFVRECTSLSKNGHNVGFVVEGENAVINGVKVVGLGEQPTNRIKRMLYFARKAYNKARVLDYDIFHFHDPEMIPYALKIKKQGKKIVYDIHENNAEAIIDKKWLPKSLRRIVSTLFDRYEINQVKKFDGIIVVTENLKNKYLPYCRNLEVVNNYPDLNDIIFHDTPFENRERIIGYAGNIGGIYGKDIVYEAMKGVNGTLILAGGYAKEQTVNIQTIGKLNRKEVNDLYGRSRVGFVLYQPAGNNYNAQPAKMFEYMAAGLPVVVSDFPLWKKIVEKNKCGICVDPKNAAEITDAFNYLLNNPQVAQEMGLNGRKAVEKEMNWANEYKKIEKLYSNL